MVRRFSSPLLALVALLTLGGGVASSYDDPPPSTPTAPGALREPANPCRGPEAASLRCPDLQMRRPYDFTVERTPKGHVLLRATSAIKSRGHGPIELHGKRNGDKTMRVTQRIYRVNGTHLNVRSAGHLYFYFIPGQGRYWKFAYAARFELWSLDSADRRKKLLRIGPKLHYCFRDLFKTGGGKHSPRKRLYPGCNQNPRKQRVVLGTSVGWSDVYPAPYHEQYLDVTGLHGCFAYVHAADPKNWIAESNESNNRAERIVRLPPRPGPQHCT
jgi:hypothetical protein